MASPAARVYRWHSGGWVGLQLKKGKVPSVGPAENIAGIRRSETGETRGLRGAPKASLNQLVLARGWKL